ncbi:MAG: hypothetical protein WC633_08075 [Desulfurivibrionaceae bacterium]|jgi:hypothetical protein
MNVELRSVTGGLSVAVIAYSCLGSFSVSDLPYSIIPTNNTPYERYTTENRVIDPYCVVFQQDLITKDKIETLHNLLSTMLENTHDLAPEFSKTVDKYFWNLS